MADETLTVLLIAKDEASKTIKMIGPTAVKAANAAARGMLRLRDALNKAARAAKSLLVGGLQRMGRFIVRVLRPGIGALVAAFAGLAAIGKFTRDAAEFRNAMSEVSTIVDTAAVSMDDLRAGVIELAKAQGANEKIVARGLYQTISSGIAAGADSLKVLGVASRLAIAGLADTETTTKLVVSTLNSFQLGVDQAERVADVFFTTVKRGQTTIPELAASMAQATPAAANLGVSLEELAASLRVGLEHLLCRE